MNDASEQFYAWLFEQGTQTIELAMKMMHTHDIEQMFRIKLNDGDGDGGEHSLAAMAKEASSHIKHVVKYLQDTTLKQQQQQQQQQQPETQMEPDTEENLRKKHLQHQKKLFKRQKQKDLIRTRTNGEFVAEPSLLLIDGF
jgi:hypothetical protein